MMSDHSEIRNYFISRISTLFFICVERLFTPYFKVERVYPINFMAGTCKDPIYRFIFASCEQLSQSILYMEINRPITYLIVGNFRC